MKVHHANEFFFHFIYVFKRNNKETRFEMFILLVYFILIILIYLVPTFSSMYYEMIKTANAVSFIKGLSEG